MVDLRTDKSSKDNAEGAEATFHMGAGADGDTEMATALVEHTQWRRARRL